MASGNLRKFEFIAIKDGKKVRGEVACADRDEAEAKIRNSGLEVVKVTEAVSLVKAGTSAKAKVSANSLKIFTRKFATMISSGVLISRALEVIASTCRDKPLKQALVSISNGLNEGKTLYQAMQEFPGIFDRTYCYLVHAGEESGTLAKSLDYVAKNIEAKESLRKKVRGAMMYPIIALVVATAVVGLLLAFVVPSLQGLFGGAGKELPALTQFVVNCSAAIQSYWWAFFIGAGILYFGIKLFRQTDGGKIFFDRLALKLPLIGHIHLLGEVIHFTRTTATLFGSGISIVDSLSYGQNVMTNSVLMAEVEAVKDQVVKGEVLGAAFTRAQYFPSILHEMLQVGEDSGTIDEMLGKAADFFEEDLNSMIGAATKLMEPILTVFIGGVIAVILIAMYLPLFSIADVF